MAGSRTLKLSILADVADLREKLGQGTKEVDTFGDKLGDFGKKAAVAFAAAGAAAAAYAGKLLVDGVKAAIEDEKAQTALATSLKNVTGATDTQIAATEKYITKTSLATGVTDDELRPSLDRLVRSTKDVEEAQKLQTLALDVAAGSGKSLETVSNALAKAYEGNETALGKLGVGISAAELKTMSFDEITKTLSDTFAGQASVQAETFAGKMDRLKVAFNEGKETVGSFVLDAITPLVTTFVDKVIPVIQDLATNIGEDLKPVFEDISTFFKETLIPIFKDWWAFLNDIVIPGIKKTVQPIIEGLFTAFSSIAKSIKDNETNLKPLFDLFKSVAKFVADKLAPAIGTILGTAFKTIGTLVSGLITGFSKLVGFIDGVVSSIKDLIKLVKDNPLVKGISGVISSVFGGGKAEGGPVSSSKSYLVGERGPELFVPNTNGNIIPNNRLGGGGVTNNFNINVSGAIDKEGVARQIVDLLNDSFYRGTLGAAGFQS
jgi:hypothetical protein